MIKAVAYYRVSTKRQFRTRLGLEAQQDSVVRYTRLSGVVIVKEYFEGESGKETNRRELRKALRYCREHDAILLIAKLDRLARNVGLILKLLESGVRFVAADKPFADRWELLRQAINDEEEGFKISDRTRRALQKAKERGVSLGKQGKVLAEINRRNANRFALEMMPVIENLKTEGFNSECKIMRQLNDQQVLSFRKCLWSPATIHALLKRIEKLKSDDPVKTEVNNNS